VPASFVPRVFMSLSRRLSQPPEVGGERGKEEAAAAADRSRVVGRRRDLMSRVGRSDELCWAAFSDPS
jgi:hypothetical protein